MSDRECLDTVVVGEVDEKSCDAVASVPLSMDAFLSAVRKMSEHKMTDEYEYIFFRVSRHGRPSKRHLATMRKLMEVDGRAIRAK